MCPEYEKHELGARIVSDFFTISGYDSVFIGAMTPIKTLLKAIDIKKPKYLCLSVTNTYNLTTTKRTIEAVKNHTDDNIRFLLGGSAFIPNPDAYRHVGGDFLLHTYEDINNRSEEHTSELQSRGHLVCRLLLEKKKKIDTNKSQACT